MRAIGGVFLAFVAVVAVACTGFGSLGGNDAGGAASSLAPGATVPPVLRTVLGAALPSAAPGSNLELVTYRIEPNTTLPVHRHPGTQVAYVREGRLTYSVVEGTVDVHEGDSVVGTIGPGETRVLDPGQWIVETSDIVHFGANEGKRPVVILAASLLDADESPAIVVETPAAS